MVDYSKIIKDLEANTNIESGFVVSRDGLLIYTDAENIHTIPFAAMNATILSSAEFAMDEIGEGIPKRIIVEGKKKNIVIVGAGKDLLLAVIVNGDFDEIFEKIAEAAKKIAAGGK
ncbi:MAG: roadblock/LC7 domain-containing protein [Thermoplasmata archaeon]|nr:roadblock/LC7 domain-containing protein [Thermoplasmata archaeon]